MCRATVTVVLYRFSTSNHNCVAVDLARGVVVLYRFSTSNHNCLLQLTNKFRVVLYRFSTSNHNLISKSGAKRALYYIVSLHQTTTV